MKTKREKYRLNAVDFAEAASKLRLAESTINTIKPMVLKGWTHRDAIAGKTDVVSESAASRAIRKLREFRESPRCCTCGHVLIDPVAQLAGVADDAPPPIPRITKSKKKKAKK